MRIERSDDSLSHQPWIVSLLIVSESSAIRKWEFFCSLGLRHCRLVGNSSLPDHGRVARHPSQERAWLPNWARTISSMGRQECRVNVTGVFNSYRLSAVT